MIKESVERVQFEALSHLEEGSALPPELNMEIDYFCNSYGLKRIEVLASIIADSVFATLFDKANMTEENGVAYICYHLQRAQGMAYYLGVKNLFYNEQYVELIVADLLGHTYNINTRGADAHDNLGDAVEYKSINLSTTVNGSFQFHWLSESKLESYKKVKDVYFALRYDSIIDEVWRLPMSIIFTDLIEKYERAEAKRLVLNKIKGIHKNKNIDAHKSYSLNKIKKLGAICVYKKDGVAVGA